MKFLVAALVIWAFSSPQVGVTPGTYRYETRNGEGALVEEGVIVLDTVPLRVDDAFTGYWHYPSLQQLGGPTGCVARSVGHTEVFRWDQGTQIRIRLVVSDHGGADAILRANEDSLVGVQRTLPDMSSVAMGNEAALDTVGRMAAHRTGPPDVESCNASLEGQILVGWDGFSPIAWGVNIRALETELETELVSAGEREPEWCDIVATPFDDGALLVMISGNEVARIDVRVPGPRAPGGIQVGAPVSEVYGAFSEIEKAPHRNLDGEYLTIVSPLDQTIQLVFETDGEFVTGFRIGRVPEIGWIEGCA